MQGFDPAFSYSKGNVMKKIKICKIFVLCLIILCSTWFNPTPAKAAFNKEKAKKNVSVTYKKLPDGVLAIYKNKNKESLKLSATMSFRDGDKKNISKEKQVNVCLGGKSTSAFFFTAPRDEYGNTINYSSYKGSYSVAKSKYTSRSSKINVSSELDVIEGSFTAINLSGKTLSNIHVTIVFYDDNGDILGCSTKYLSCYEKNSMEQFSIGYAGKMYQPSKVKIYVDWAY